MTFLYNIYQQTGHFRISDKIHYLVISQVSQSFKQKNTPIQKGKGYSFIVFIRLIKLRFAEMSRYPLNYYICFHNYFSFCCFLNNVRGLSVIFKKNYLSQFETINFYLTAYILKPYLYFSTSVETIQPQTSTLFFFHRELIESTI